MMDAAHKLRSVKLIVSDFDGVMTDNRVLVGENGVESVFCSRADGLGIEMLKKKGIEIIVLSKEKNKVVEARCRKLGIRCIQGIDRKKSEFLKIVKESGLRKEEICFVGNEINDLECINESFVSVAPSDAHASVLGCVSYVAKARGGHGVFRELADLIC